MITCRACADSRWLGTTLLGLAVLLAGPPRFQAAATADNRQTTNESSTMVDLLQSHQAPSVLTALKSWLLESPDDASPPIELVTQCLGHEEGMIRQYAAEVLLRYADQAASAVDALSSAVRHDTDTRVRGTAAAALSAIGQPAYDAIGALLQDANPRVRRTVATALLAAPTLPDEQRRLVAFAAPPVGVDSASAIPDGSFEAGARGDQLVGWEVHFRDGATGSWELDATRSRTGRRSLKLIKTNGVGYIDLCTTHPIVVPRGTQVVTCRAWFHCEDAPVSSTLMLRVEGEDGKLMMGDAARSGFEQQSQTHLRNQPPHVWDKRVLEIKPSDEDRRLTLHVILYGNPTTVWLDDIAFPAEPWKGVSIDPIPPQPRFTRQELIKRLERETPVTYQFGSDGRRGVLQRNGQPIGAVLHFAFRPGHANFGDFDDAGVPLQVVRLPIDDHAGVLAEDRFREPALGPMWPSAGTQAYDFREAVRRIEQALRQMPTSRLILGLHVNWPRDYVHHNPDTRWLDERGRGACGNVMFLRSFEKQLPEGMIWWPSPYHPKPIEDAAEVIRQLVLHLRTTPYWPHVAGFFVLGGHDGQFHIRAPDYSQTATHAWRQWLAQRYGSDEALAQAWHRPGATLATAVVPRSAQAHQLPTDSPRSRMFFDPAAEADQADHNRYRLERMWRVKETLLKAAIDASDRPMIGLTYHMGGASEDDFRPFFASEVMDACVVQPKYQYRLPGYVGGTPGPFQSFNRHGKLLITEMDTRSWLRTYEDEIYTMRIGVPMSDHEFRMLNRKEVGPSLANDFGCWYYDIGDTTFNHPAMMDEIARTTRIANHVAERPGAFQPDVAIVYSSDTIHWARITHYGYRNIVMWYQQWLEREIAVSGVPADRLTLDDLMADPDAGRYRLYVFFDTYFLNSAQRRFVERLKSSGRTIMWHYAPGYLSEQAADTRQIAMVTGIRVRTSVTDRRPARALAIPSTDPLAVGLRPLQGSGDIFRTHWFPVADTVNANDPQRFVIDDDEASVLAVYADDEQPAIAVRRFEDWTSIYVTPAAGLSAELLHNAARQAGVYVATRPGLMLHLSDRFLSVHAIQGGRYDIQLPHIATVLDAHTGQAVTSKEGALTIDIAAQESRWYLLNP